MIFGPCQETSYTAITLNPESNFTRREKNHSLFHWNTLTYPELLIRIWMSSKSDASMIIGISMGHKICLIHKQVSLNVLYWTKNLQTDIYGLGEINEKTADIQASIDPEDKEFKETIKNARKKLETPMAPAMPCKIIKTTRILGVVHPIKSNQNLRVFWKLVNLQDCVWENHCRLIMKTILQEKETTHYSLKNLVHKFIPMPQARKFSAAKAAADKEWEKLKNISAWNLTKVKSKKEVIDEARSKDAKVHFASLMDICQLKNAELEAKHQKYKGRVVLRGDAVKDDSGSYAVFTEHGSSASQMTAAKVMDIISRLPGCAGQAADSVSAYTQVKMENAPKLLKIPKSECPDIWIRLPRHKWPKSWSSMEDPVVPLERNLYGHPLSGLLWERPFEKILLQHGW